MKKLLFILAVVLVSLSTNAQVIKDDCLRFEQSFVTIDSISFNPVGNENTIVLYSDNGLNFWITKDKNGCRKINHPYNGSKDTVSIDLLDENIYNDIKIGNFHDYIVYYEAFFQLSQSKYWTFEVAKREIFSQGMYKITRIRRIFDCSESACDGFNPVRYLDIEFEQIETGSGPKTISVMFDMQYNPNIYAVGDIFEMMKSSDGIRHFIFKNSAIHNH